MKNIHTYSTMSYPQGTTLDNFHSTTIHKNALLSSPDESWLLTNLLYHVFQELTIVFI